MIDAEEMWRDRTRTVRHGVARKSDCEWYGANNKNARREKVLPKCCFLIDQVGHGLNFVQGTRLVWYSGTRFERFRLDATVTLKQTSCTYIYTAVYTGSRTINLPADSCFDSRERGARGYELHKILVSPCSRAAAFSVW